MAEQNDFTITVDGKEYKFDELEAENKALVGHIRDLESQLEQVNFKFEQINASKLFFSDKLIQNLKQPADQVDAPAEEAATSESSDSE
tara:strand:- start:491 stop:754 length:264 start_codon:yes stop_codon:yes gene_type:complete